MKPEDLEYIKKELQKTVEAKVNGKIDRLNKEFDKRFTALEDKMEPVYDAYHSANRMGVFVIWISKVILAISIVIASFWAFFKP